MATYSLVLSRREGFVKRDSMILSDLSTLYKSKIVLQSGLEPEGWRQGQLCWRYENPTTSFRDGRELWVFSEVLFFRDDRLEGVCSPM
jgi:hypothetical protein